MLDLSKKREVDHLYIADIGRIKEEFVSKILKVKLVT
jgi:hypothetical protein